MSKIICKTDMYLSKESPLQGTIVKRSVAPSGASVYSYLYPNKEARNFTTTVTGLETIKAVKTLMIEKGYEKYIFASGEKVISSIVTLMMEYSEESGFLMTMDFSNPEQIELIHADEDIAKSINVKRKELKEMIKEEIELSKSRPARPTVNFVG